MADTNSRTRSPETRKKISEALKGRPKPEGFGEAVSRANKGKPRGPHSAQQRARMSEAHRGKKHSEETKRKISEATKGRVVSDETRRRMSEAKKNQARPNIQRGLHPNAKRVRQLTMDGEVVRVWDSLRSVTDDPQFPSTSIISECCHGRREKYKGFRWEYETPGTPQTETAGERENGSS